MYGEEDGEQLAGSYGIFFAEGDNLAKQGEYIKAIDSFSKALEFQPNDQACLVARSKCYLQLGDTTAALKDAEASLKDDPKYHGGLYRKAETLYRMGDFEHALMFYHRGSKIRPDLSEFKLGIQKTQEAITNSIGTPEAIQLDKTGDLSFFKQQDTVGKKKAAKVQKAAHLQTKAKQGPVASERTLKELLGELYPDREYLEKLSKDERIGNKDNSIYTLIDEGISYLDTRAEFWRQQKPMYTRKREKILRRWKPAPTRPQNPMSSTRSGGTNKEQYTDHTKYVLKALENIDNSLANGDAEKSLKLAEQAMMMVLSLSDTDLPNRSQFIATLHSCLGNAHLELGHTDQAIEHFEKDKTIAEDEDYPDALGRALYNLGHAYSILNDYEKGIGFWLKRIPLLKTSEESAWLFHEIGRAYWEDGKYNEAKEYGMKSLTAAQDSQDQFWQLNASMLVAQTEVKIGDLSTALASFKTCLTLAEVLDDTDSQDAIRKAIDEVNSQIVESIQQNTEDTSQEHPSPEHTNTAGEEEETS